jgi:hypothetical protein
MLIQPGRSAATRHPKTGEPVTPIGYRRNGTAIWPVLGASSDDPDDPAYTGTPPDDDDDDEDDEEDDEDEEDEDDKKPAKKAAKKTPKHAKDDEDDEDAPKYTQADMDRVRSRMRAADKRSSDLEARLKRIEDKDKKPEEIAERDRKEREARVEKAEAAARSTKLENVFLRDRTIDWVDMDDAFAVATRDGVLDDVVDESGTVDRKALARSLRDLAKRKPHLVRKPKTSGPADDDDSDDDDQGSVTTPTMNGKRKGSRPSTDRARLASRFPAIRNR